MRLLNLNFSLSPTHTPLLYTDPQPRVFRERRTSIQRFPVRGEGVHRRGMAWGEGYPFLRGVSPVNALPHPSMPSVGGLVGPTEVEHRKSYETRQLIVQTDQ